MGADLILAACPIEVDEKTARSRLAALTDANLVAAWLDWQGYELEELDEEPDAAVIRKGLEQALGYVFDTSKAGPRDVTSFVFGDVTVLVGGGTSWGDTPEGYDEVGLLLSSGVTLRGD